MDETTDENDKNGSECHHNSARYGPETWDPILDCGRAAEEQCELKFNSNSLEKNERIFDERIAHLPCAFYSPENCD